MRRERAAIKLQGAQRRRLAVARFNAAKAAQVKAVNAAGKMEAEKVHCMEEAKVGGSWFKTMKLLVPLLMVALLGSAQQLKVTGAAWEKTTGSKSAGLVQDINETYEKPQLECGQVGMVVFNFSMKMYYLKDSSKDNSTAIDIFC